MEEPLPSSVRGTPPVRLKAVLRPRGHRACRIGQGDAVCPDTFGCLVGSAYWGAHHAGLIASRAAAVSFPVGCSRFGMWMVSLLSRIDGVCVTNRSGPNEFPS